MFQSQKGRPHGASLEEAPDLACQRHFHDAVLLRAGQRMMHLRKTDLSCFAFLPQ